MESQTTNTETKQITIDVPADRLAEFYAFFGRFLAGGPGRGRRRQPGRHGHHGHHCGHHRGEAAEAGGESETASTGGGPGGTTDL